MSENSTAVIPELIVSAEKAMARTLGAEVRLLNPEVLRDRGYVRVLRCDVQSDAAEVSPQVVIKRFGVRGDGNYALAEAQKPWGGLFSEWAGTRFLQGLGEEPQFGPRCFGGDTSTGIVVIEDLGNGASLADALQGQSREELENGLLLYSASLGRLHAATVGRGTEMESVWTSLGQQWNVKDTPYRQAENWPRENCEPFQNSCEALGATVAKGFDAEAESVWQTMAQPGPFLAFTPGDTCPDNNRLTSGPYAKFFDFECCGFRHALLEAAYCYVPFPTCWCALQMPTSFSPLLSESYRSELIKGCPAAGDDELFFDALAKGCASWAISYLSWNLNEALEKDGSRGLASVRQRALLHLDAFVTTADWLGRLPAIRDTAESLASRLRSTWGEELEVPYFPALREK